MEESSSNSFEILEKFCESSDLSNIKCDSIQKDEFNPGPIDFKRDSMLI